MLSPKFLKWKQASKSTMQQNDKKKGKMANEEKSHKPKEVCSPFLAQNSSNLICSGQCLSENVTKRHASGKKTRCQSCNASFSSLELI